MLICSAPVVAMVTTNCGSDIAATYLPLPNGSTAHTADTHTSPDVLYGTANATASAGTGEVTKNAIPGRNAGSVLVDDAHFRYGGYTRAALYPPYKLSPISNTGLANDISHNIKQRAVHANESKVQRDAVMAPLHSGPMIDTDKEAADIAITHALKGSDNVCVERRDGNSHGLTSLIYAFDCVTDLTEVPFAVPGSPTIVRVSPGDGQITIYFTPGDDGGSPITNYQYTLNGGTNWISFSPQVTGSSVTITGLTNGTQYTIQLRAVNNDGPGAATNPVTGTPPLPMTFTTVCPDNTFNADPSNGFMFSEQQQDIIDQLLTDYWGGPEGEGELQWHSQTPATFGSFISDVSALLPGTYYINFTTGDGYLGPIVVTINGTACPGCITVVESGGDAEGSTWTFSSGVIMPTSSSNVNLNASDVLAKLALGNLSVNGKCIMVNANVTYTTDANGITFKATDYVNLGAGKTLTTNGGKIIFWSDSDASGNGAISIGDNSTINTTNGATTSGLSGGGLLVLAGGADDGSNGGTASDGVPDGFAASSSNNGIKIGTTTASSTEMYSGGGDIIINGKSSLVGAIVEDRVGVFQYGKWTANSGKGAIRIAGVSGNFYGVSFVKPVINSTSTDKHLILISDKASGDAITITGSSTTNYGVVFDFNNPKEILATGGGNIVITGAAGSNYGVFFQNQDILASTGSITINGGTRGIRTFSEGARFGSKAGSDITSSSSDVVLTGDVLTFDNLNSGFTTSFATAGKVTLQSSGAGFSSAVNTANLTIGTGVSELTIGKTTNTTKVTMGSTTSIAGPVSVYGGFINVTAPITAAGNILLDADSGSFLAQDEIGVLVGADVKTTNNGNITILGRGGSVTTNFGRHGVNITKLVEADGTGTINITGYGGLSVFNTTSGSDHGINIEGANSWVKSNGGNINLIGYGGGANAGTYNQGISMLNGKLSAGGSGTISITGTGGVNTVVGLRGVVIVDGSSVFTAGGSIEIIGNTGTNGLDNSDGVTVHNSTIGSASSGPITITGAAGGGTGSEALSFSGTNTLGAANYAGDIILRGNSFSTANTTTISTTGKVTFEPAGNSFTSSFSIPSSFVMGSGITGLTIGKSTNTANITLNAATTVAGPITVYGGDITVSQNLNTETGNAAGDILLKASNNVSLAASKSVTTNGGDVVLWSDSDASGNDNAAGGTISLLASSAISTSNGKIVLAGGADDGSNGGTPSDGIPDGYAIGAFINNPARGATNARTGLFLDGANINAGSGAIILRGQGTGAAAQGSGLNFQMGTRLYKSTIKGADIRIEGKGSKFSPGNNSSSNWGLSFEGSSIEGSGNMALFGWGGRAGAGNEDVGHAGVEIRSTLDSPTTPSQIKATGSGTISINGVGGSGAFAFPSYGLGADGIRIQSGQTNPVLSADGNITLNGTSGYNGRGAGINILSPISSTNGNIRLNGFASIEGTVGINGNVVINGKVSTSGDVYVESPGIVSQTAEILADGLGLFGTGTFTLTNTSNNVVTIAGGDNTTKLGNVSYVDASGGLTIGSVNPTGITSTGPVSIVTSTGNISVGANVSTTDASADAILINAGQSKSPGDASGGNILVTGAYSVTTGSGGIVKLLAGTKNGSVGITQLVSESNEQVNVDETSTFSPALTAGNTYGLYRSETKEYIYNETGLFESLTLNVPHTVKFAPNNTLTMKRTSDIGAGITIDVDCNDFSNTAISNPDYISGKRSLFDIEYDSDQGMDGTVNYEFEFSDKLPSNGYMMFVDVDFKESLKIKAYKANGDLIPYSDFTLARENGKMSAGNTYTNTVFQDLGSSYSGHLTTLAKQNVADPVVTLSCAQDIKKIVFEFNQNATNDINEDKTMSFGFIQPNTPRTIYVNQSATGAGNGTSWANAYTSLQTALDNAFAGDKVWVAKGVYKPSSAHFIPNTTRNYHFRLVDDVEVYGGFAGTETAEAQRTNFGFEESNATILSGDLSGNDNYTVAPWTGTSENTYHVVYTPDEEICALTSSTVLDGFVLLGGKADGTGTDSNNDGGGMVIRDNSPRLANLDFRYNQCLDKGGAVYLVDCNSVIDNITIVQNENAGDDGGGLAVNSGDPTITNALIVNNKAKIDGGGLYLDDATPIITNATIANNRADDDGGGIYLTAAVSGSDTLYLRNSILWGNTAGDSRNQMFRSNARSVFNYVLYKDSTNDVTTSSMAAGSSNNLTINPRFINDVGMDFRLQGVSPGVDSGNDSYNSLATDIRRNNFGRKRAKTDATQTGTIDRGAFEYNETTEDSDGDGVPDVVENEGCTGPSFCDTDGDGIEDIADNDSDGDGIPDAYEDKACTGVLPCAPTDSDNDGIPDFQDLDSDSDGIADDDENSDCTGTLPCVPTDTDNDGTPDYLDADSDGDGIPDVVEDSFCDGMMTLETLSLVEATGTTSTCDTDNDGTPDFRDLDSDGDGIPDSIEDTACTGTGSCIPTDSDNDGTPDYLDSDSDDDGIPDATEDVACTGTLPCTPTDSDNDGTPNYLDADSDGDGIPDATEDVACTSILPCTPTDSDNDGTPNYLDADSDGDGIPDATEDVACTGILPCTPTDSDDDNTPDYLDTDSDGDGIPDATEDLACTGTVPCAPTDSDNDGTPNYLDIDSDGDGIPDEIENSACEIPGIIQTIGLQATINGVLACDTDNDGTPNFLDTDSDGDGIHDDVEDGACSGTAPCAPTDSDEDGTPDYLDADSDGDNIPDAIENDACDIFPDMPVITVTINAGVSTTCDADDDGIPNYLDVDSDGDGLSDDDEDTNCSGVVPCTPNDKDNDGLPDFLEGCTNPDDAGAISGNQYICEGMVPGKIASLSLPTGETGDLEYKWQSSPSGGGTGYVDIPNSNSPEYQPGELVHDRWYRRLARVDCEEDWSEAAISNESAVIVKKPANQYLVVQTLQQPKCDPPTGCKVTISGLPVVTWRMEQNGPVDGYINGSGNPYTIENLPDGVYQFQVATSEGCFQTPPFGVIIVTY